MEVVGDNWSYKTCNDPVKSSLPSCHKTTPNFYKPDAFHVIQPTASKQECLAEFDKAKRLLVHHWIYL